MKINIKDIPDDIYEMQYADDISYTGPENFNKVMLDRGYFRIGFERRSHRIITRKFTEANINDVICDITGLSLDEYNKYISDEKEKRELKEIKKRFKNIELFVDNDYIQIKNKADVAELKALEDEFSDEIYSAEDNEIKTKFYALDKKIDSETVQIDYSHTGELLELLFEKLGLQIKIERA